VRRGAWLASFALQSKRQLTLSLGTVRYDPRLALGLTGKKPHPKKYWVLADGKPSAATPTSRSSKRRVELDFFSLGTGQAPSGA